MNLDVDRKTATCCFAPLENRLLFNTVEPCLFKLGYSKFPVIIIWNSKPFSSDSPFSRLLSVISNSHYFELQLSLANLNWNISNSPLFGTRNHIPLIHSSVIYYRLFRTPAISNYSWASLIWTGIFQIPRYLELKT